MDSRQNNSDIILNTESGLEKKPEIDIQNMTFEQMNVSTVQKILSDHIDGGIVEESPLADSSQNIIILEVTSLEEGLDKACKLFEVEEKEINCKILNESGGDGGSKEGKLLRIEFSQRVTSGEIEIVVSEDKMSASISSLYPRKPDGSPTTFMDIIKLVRELNIKYGINADLIKKALEKVIDEYDVIQNIVFALGEDPGEGKNSERIESVFNSLNEISNIEIHGKSLEELINQLAIEKVEVDTFPALFVKKGEVIAKTTLPGEGKKGKNIFGEEIPSVMGKKLITPGQNIEMALSKEAINYVASISGYLECEGNELMVISPLWLSKDEQIACFIKLPTLNKTPIDFKLELSTDMMKKDNISNGIKIDQLAQISSVLKNEPDKFEKLVIAEGTLAQKGDDAKIELFFSKDYQKSKIREDGSVDYREIEKKDMVKAKQLVAVKYRPKPGKAGISIKGNEIPAEDGTNIVLKGINNITTVKSTEKILYYSTIDGRVDLVGENGISVNKLYEIKGDVDFKSGNIDFDGDVRIGGSVMAGFTVKANGNIIIEGSVNQKVSIESKGNVSIREGIIGKDDISITAKGNVTALFMQGAHVKAGGDVIIRDYILNSNIRAYGKVVTPSLEEKATGKGSIIGGDIYGIKGIISNIIGSEVSSNTRLISGFDFSFESTLNDLQKAIKYCEYEIAKISKTLRLGINDTEKIKLLIKKLPPVKQRPFIETFKKLSKMNSLREKVIERIDKLHKSAENLSRDAKIIVRQQLFPKVYIQIGKNKTNNNQYMLKMKITANEADKDLVMESLS